MCRGKHFLKTLPLHEEGGRCPFGSTCDIILDIDVPLWKKRCILFSSLIHRIGDGSRQQIVKSPLERFGLIGLSEWVRK